MSTAWTLHIDKNHIAWLTFDQPGSKVNTLSSATLGELDGCWMRCATPDVAALVIRSGKKDSFVVGADIGELAGVTDEATARSLTQAGHGSSGRSPRCRCRPSR